VIQKCPWCQATDIRNVLPRGVAGNVLWRCLRCGNRWWVENGKPIKAYQGDSRLIPSRKLTSQEQESGTAKGEAQWDPETIELAYIAAVLQEEGKLAGIEESPERVQIPKWRRRRRARRRRGSSYRPVPLKPYTPVPLKPYLKVPVKSYLAAPLEQYLAVPRKRFLPKPDRKLVGIKLMEGELEVLKGIGRAGGATTVLVLSRTLEKGFRRVFIDCQALAEADYINVFESGFCRIRPLGWQELEKDGERYAGAAYSDSEVSYVELQVLKALAEAGGAIPLFTLSEQMEMRRREMAILCSELGQDNYIDLFQSKLVQLTKQGWKEVERIGLIGGYEYSRPTMSLGARNLLKALGEAGGEATAKELASTLGIARREAAIYCQALGQGDKIDFFVSGLCQMKRKGWQELEKAGLVGQEYPHPDISVEKQKVLAAIGVVGGETTVKELADRLGMARREAAFVCQGLGQGDYIDFFESGLCQVKRKGWQQIDKLIDIDRIKEIDKLIEAERKRKGD